MTIWGALITASATVLPALGPAIGIDVAPETIRELGDRVVDVMQVLGGLIGTVMTIYGRKRARTRLVRRDVRVIL